MTEISDYSEKKYYFKFKDNIFSSENVSFIRCDNLGNRLSNWSYLKISDSGYAINIDFKDHRKNQKYIKYFVDEVFEKMQQTNFIDLNKIDEYCRDKLKNIDVDMSTE